MIDSRIADKIKLQPFFSVVFFAWRHDPKITLSRDESFFRITEADKSPHNRLYYT